MPRVRVQRRWLCLAGIVPTFSSAHSFGAVYVLPVPFWMYVYACVAILLLTFSLLGILVTAPPAQVRAPGWLESSRRSIALNPLLFGVLRSGAIVCLLVSTFAGLFGSTDPVRNLGMTLFWTMFLLGFAYISLTAGDLYALINPWRAAVDWLERMGGNLTVRRVRWPRPLGYWPAVAFYMLLVGIELFERATPRATAILLLIYSAITLAGCRAFGKTVWFRRADFFSIYFQMIGRLAPAEYKRSRGIPGRWQVSLRSPFKGALRCRPAHIGIVLFVLFMLSSTTYDAILATVLWADLFWRNALSIFEAVWGDDLGQAQAVLMDWYLLYRKAGLLIFPLLYLGMYLMVLYLAKLITRSAIPLRTLSLTLLFAAADRGCLSLHALFHLSLGADEGAAIVVVGPPGYRLEPVVTRWRRSRRTFDPGDGHRVAYADRSIARRSRCQHLSGACHGHANIFKPAPGHQPGADSDPDGCLYHRRSVDLITSIGNRAGLISCHGLQPGVKGAPPVVRAVRALPRANCSTLKQSRSKHQRFTAVISYSPRAVTDRRKRPGASRTCHRVVPLGCVFFAMPTLSSLAPHAYAQSPATRRVTGRRATASLVSATKARRSQNSCRPSKYVSRAAGEAGNTEKASKRKPGESG